MGLMNWLFGKPENKYAALAAQSLAASRARFHTWTFQPETLSLDAETASVEQIERAMKDCWRCTATEYPETEEGTEYALKRAEALEEALNRRFPAQASSVIDRCATAAESAANIAHPIRR